MGFKRISSMSDDEKEKWLEETNNRISTNNEARQNEIKGANELFERISTRVTNNELPVANKNNIGNFLTQGSLGKAITTGSREAIQKIKNPEEIQKNDTRKWFEPSSAFDDGYQFGDVTRAVTGSLADVGQDLTKGITGIGEGLQDTGAYLVGLKADIEKNFLEKKIKDESFKSLSDEEKKKLITNYIANQNVSKDMQDFIKRNLIEESNIANVAANTGLAGITNRALNNNLNGDIRQDTFESNSVLGDKTDAVVQSAGQLAGQIGLTAVGVPWYATTGVTSFGGGVQEAYNEGATTSQAGMYGLINAGAEILSEKISGGISFGGKTLDKNLANNLTKNISSRTLKALAKFGIDATGEGFEEIFSEVMSNIGKKLTYANDKTWQEILFSPEALDSYIESFIGGFALGGGANTVRLGSSIKNGTDYETGLTQQQEKTVDQELVKRTEGQNLNKKQIEDIKDNIIDEVRIGKLPVANEENRYTNKIVPIENNQETVYNVEKGDVGNYEYGEEQRRDSRELQKLFANERRTTNEQGNDKNVLGNEEAKERKKQRIIELKNKTIEYAEKYPSKDLTKAEKDLINLIERNTGIKTIVYNLGGDTLFGGNTKNGKMYIDKGIFDPNSIDILNDTNSINLIYHELIHGLRQTNNEVYLNELYPITADIVNDYENVDVLIQYIIEKSSEYTVEDLEKPEVRLEIAEEILGNTIANIYGDYATKYDLNDDMIKGIKKSIDKILLNQELEQSSSFSMENTESKAIKQTTPTAKEELPNTKAFLSEKRSKNTPTVKEVKDTFMQKFVNKGHYIDQYAKKTNNPELTYKYDRTMNSFNEAQISIGKHQIDHNGNVVGKSLIEIFKPAVGSKLKTEFEDYLLNKHNISRDLVGKNIYGGEVTAPQSSKIIENYEKQYPQFKEWAKEVYKYNDNNIKDLVSAGMVSENLYKNVKQLYKDYVPTYRDIVQTMQEFEDEKVGNNTLKRATQSDKKILSVQESMAEQTLAIKKAIRINEVGLELAKTLGKNDYILQDIKVDPTIIQTIGGDVVDKAKDGYNTFTVFKDGEMSTFKISDDIYSAFAKDTIQNRVNNSKIAKALLTPVEKLSQAQRNLLTTYNIGFALRNPIKDIQDAFFNTKYSSAQFSKNYVKALYNIAKNGDWYKSYINNGGTANTYFDYSKGLLPTKQNIAKRLVNKIKSVNEVMEQAPRLAEYISTIENGGTINEALYNASDITVNFKRGGDVTKAINKYGANFLNASVQGLDKTIRNITGRNGVKGYANLALKATLFQIAPAILNGLLLGDDEEYEDLPEYTKDNYFLIKMEDGDFFRIPKGRFSSVVGGIARRVLETAQGKEVDWKSIIDTTVNQLAPNNPLTDNIVAPIKQAVDNKAWFGGEIVGSRLQKLPNAEQYDETTDELSKWLGEKLNISPKKINYLLDQYSGGIGDLLLPMMTPQAENNILTDQFTTNAIMKNKNVSKYYNKLEELEKLSNSVKATNEDKIKYKYMTEASKEFNDLYAQKREIQNSNSSDEEKKKQVKEVQKQINSIVEERLKTIEKGTFSKNNYPGYATMGDSQYIKYKDDTWESISEEDKEKNKKAGISLKDYAGYKADLYDTTQKQKKSGQLKDNQQLKDADKMQILIDSNYSNNTKNALYENYIKSSNDKKYDIIKSTGIDINEYLKYKLADSNGEFSADKKDDGTVKGKSITNSAKNKRYNYIKSMNITGTQKAILFGLNSTPSESDKRLIANYITTLPGKTKQEKLDMLGEFSWIKVYKDGTYSF